jgi:hypothetical protein
MLKIAQDIYVMQIKNWMVVNPDLKILSANTSPNNSNIFSPEIYPARTRITYLILSS